MDNSSFHTIIKLEIIGVPYHSPFYIFKWSYNFIFIFFQLDLNLSPYRSLPFTDFSFSMSLMVVGHFWYFSSYHDVPTKHQVPHPIAYRKKITMTQIFYVLTFVSTSVFLGLIAQIPFL
jgi:hypothetical protein